MTESRHPSVDSLLAFFDSDHLPPAMAPLFGQCKTLAIAMADSLPDSPELSAGLRKLLEAQDCFVRARMSQIKEEGY